MYSSFRLSEDLNLTNKLKEYGIPLSYEYYDPKLELNDLPDILGQKCERVDCSTVALSKLLNRNYDEIFDLQLKYCAELHAGIDQSHIIDLVANGFGYNTFKAFDIRKHSVFTFCINHLSGRFALWHDEHIFAYIDGIIYGTQQYCNEHARDQILQIHLFRELSAVTTTLSEDEL